MVFTTKRKVNIATIRVVIASILDTSGVCRYINVEMNKLTRMTTKTVIIGMNIVRVVPNLCSPHGIWLKIGRKGGRFLYVSKI